MRTILFVTSELDYNGPARQLTLLAPGLMQRGFRLHGVILGGPSPWVESLRAAGVPLEVLDWRRPLDVRPVLALARRIRRLAPDVIHVWKRAALAPVLLSGGVPGRLLLTSVLPPDGRMSLLSRGLLRRVGGVLALGQSEAHRYRALGIAEERLSVALPAVPTPTAPAAPAALAGVPAGEPVVLAIGPIEMHKGFRELVWALDILLHGRHRGVYLVLAGTGSDEQRVRRFARRIEVEDHVRFLGPCPDLTPWLGRADLVCVPSLRPGGAGAALEAMAAGKPVVASRGVGLEEIVVDGQTGYLTRPGDKAGLARQIHRLLEDKETRRRFGEAGRARAAALFTPEQLLEACAQLYQRWPRKKTDLSA